MRCPENIEGNFAKAGVDWSEDASFTRLDAEEEVAHTTEKLHQPYTKATVMTMNLLDERMIPYGLIVCLIEKLCLEESSDSRYGSAILVFMPGLGEIRRLMDILMEHAVFGTTAYRIYPLHSMISTENQSAAFEVPPEGIRKIVIGVQ